MAKKSKLYDRAPVWLQNLMVTGFGGLRHYQKYGGNFRREVTSLLESQWWSPERLAELGEDNLHPMQ